MKKAILILAAIVLFFAGCKEDDVTEASMMEMKDETIERGWDYIKISGEYDYPVVLEAMTLYLSEKEDMSGAETYGCVIDGKTFSVEADDLKDGTKYHYQYEYDNGYVKEKGEKGNAVTIDKPTVITKDAGGVTTVSAVLTGEVTNNDAANKIEERGLCWGTEPQSTIAGNHHNCGGDTGVGTSTFSYNLTNLQNNTTYYFRAYIKTNFGIVYGEEKSFTTMEKPVNQTISVNGVSFTMIAVEGGTFQMGATSEQSSWSNIDEYPVHTVTLSDYYIGETEVTQELWEAVMGSNPSFFSGNPQRPVEMVSWNDCKEFITKLNNLTGKNFRLPTEAEWEYAARGGNESQGYKYSGSDTIGNVAWYYGNSSSTTHNVKTKSPNELGIYDMNGNVWEWCEDWYGSYSSSSQTNPTGPSSGSFRVLRGASWRHGSIYCRVSERHRNFPDYRRDTYGFRLAFLMYN